MTRRSGVTLGCLVLAAVGWVVCALTCGDAGPVVDLWPVGLATGVVLHASARLRPVAVGVVLVVAAGALAAGGLSLDVAVGYGLAAALTTVVAALLLDRGDRSLRTDADLRRYLLACGASALVAAGVAAVTVALVGPERPDLAALGLGAATSASQLALLPAFLSLPQTDVTADVPAAARAERIGQWTVLVVLTPTVFLLHTSTSVVFLVIPILAWAALRLTTREAVAQLIGVFVVAQALTALGSGPYRSASTAIADGAVGRSVALSAFLAASALVVAPLVLRVGEHVTVVRDAARERDLVRNIVDSTTGVAIVGADVDGRIRLFNPGAERLLGYRSEEVIGRPSRMLHRPEAISATAHDLGVADDYQVVVRAIIAERAAEHVRFLRKDGVERVHAMTLNELTDPDGNPVGYLSTSEDVTDELDAKRALVEALDAERTAADRLRHVDGVKDAFVSTVSHELRTPITSILGYLEVLEDGMLGDLTPRQLDAVLRVSSNSNRLLVLIDNLLTLSRVNEHGIALRETEFDLAEAVDAAYRVLAPSWATLRDLTVTWERPAPTMVVGDRDMLERVVVNLLGNAVKFTPDGGAVHLDLDVEGPNAALMVADTGIGIPDDEQDQLFSRFFRSTLAEGEAIPGSGLGLSISRSIVEQHGGSILVQSAVGLGTTVHVRVPLSPSAAPVGGDDSRRVAEPSRERAQA